MSELRWAAVVQARPSCTVAASLRSISQRPPSKAPPPKNTQEQLAFSSSSSVSLSLSLSVALCFMLYTYVSSALRASMRSLTCRGREGRREAQRGSGGVRRIGG